MSSLLSVIRNAVRSGAADDVLGEVEGEQGAQAPNPETPRNEATIEGGSMSGTQTVAGAAHAATATIAAVAAATGGADGFKTAMDRVTAVLGAQGIKGDGKRMSAALDLATASPDMAAEAIVSFVTANVTASTAQAGDPALAESPAQASQATPAPGAYEATVQAAASLAMPGGASASAAPASGLSKAVSARIEAMKPAR